MEKGCEYCNNQKTIFHIEIVESIGFDYKITGYEDVPLFVDRGYLRMIDKSDSMCLDHGEKTMINYCPMCGTKLWEV